MRLFPSATPLNVYNATVSGGKLTLTERNNQVAKKEGVLLKTDGEYVNAKANERNVLTAASSDENYLVATPAETQTITPETGYILYRLTYNDADTKDRLGFYLAYLSTLEVEDSFNSAMTLHVSTHNGDSLYACCLVAATEYKAASECCR